MTKWGIIDVIDYNMINNTEKVRIEVRHECRLNKEDHLPSEEIMDTIEGLNNLRNVMSNPYFGAMGTRSDGEEYGEISARLRKNVFLCNAEKTNNLESLSIEHFPLIFFYQEGGNILYSEGYGELRPSEKIAIHDGFYRGDSRINCVAHGYSPLINRYAARHGAVIIPNDIDDNIRLRKFAIEHGKDGEIFIPGNESDSFYIVGNSINNVLKILLASGNRSLVETMNFFNKELSLLY